MQRMGIGPTKEREQKARSWRVKSEERNLQIQLIIKNKQLSIILANARS